MLMIYLSTIVNDTSVLMSITLGVSGILMTGISMGYIFKLTISPRIEFWYDSLDD